MFCGTTELIQYNISFFYCPYAKFLWRMCHIALGLIMEGRTIYFCWEQHIFAGLYGYVETMLFLRKLDQNPFCRFFSRELTSFGYGPSCSEVKSELKIVEGCRRMETVAIQVFVSFG